ncbi:MAG TPA: hypothetical protein VIL90_02410 [Puia sp.]
MNTIILNPGYANLTLNKKSKSIFLVRFLNWSKEEEKNRIAWVGISITIMTAIFFPVTMVAILLHGASFKLIIIAMFSLILVVIPNLAALPTRITIPAFSIGMLLDILLVIASFFI